MNIFHDLTSQNPLALVQNGNKTNPSKALILVHGRGASAHNIMQLTHQLSVPKDYIVLAPEAENNTWYPQRFIVPQNENQPYLDKALLGIEEILSSLQKKFGIETKDIILAGFSQGACLVAEYLKQHPRKYQGALVFSGGLIGDDTEVRASSHGDLKGTPVYLGCDELDFHIPKERVELSAEVLREMKAEVDMKIYSGLGHAIHPEGIQALQDIINS